ncbi:ATP-dependent helicase HepA [Desulfocicer vacuolatum DSM 3385]|uniref:ATP-dependent helicase HepA n=1 Tax=Desulfocicer vacuolatum DSM 3385 TaxID=1121400 RepID=A0A1W2B874_9BACT|nr:helicase-related protein [Desulfocicer vacuolatum]SMC69126.1 ATP-dependent helicase HepA [Desulfocicer vacuolatum DSM 3385]
MFKKGQRWISRMEPELGLGTLRAVENNGRRVCIQFEASDLVRHYSMESAPLERACFSPGDVVFLRDSSTFTVTKVETKDGLFHYHGKGNVVSEEKLSDTMSFSTPKERLGAGLFDATSTFDLRLQARNLLHQYHRSSVMGFLGGRVELIPHQFYIAGAVASRYLPRVLLADETGLGKTIEASLIMHRLLLSERISRVLILVPDSLVHQWFVEMYRRFNLSFSIVNESFLACIKKTDNLFLEEQLFICPMHCMEENFFLKQRALDAPWDMVVVDEAHHVDPCGETHGFLKHIGHGSAGMMLLTATPEQLGVERHFAHLKLLDPHRYTTLDAHRKEAAAYEKTVQELSAHMEKQVGRDGTLGKSLEMRLDCYGPGRSIFRNTRAVIKGFPVRKGEIYPLLSPHDEIRWLARLLKQLKSEKVLLICSTRERAMAIGKVLREVMTLKFTQFDESMTLLQRDRSAAWFSEKEGARLMICSEIGSEGRNFQFCHHLVLFDLPRNPELLEQRIGRLDRIGQARDIEIHVPFLKGSSQEVLARWYKDGTGIFHGHVSGLCQIHGRFKSTLNSLCNACDQGNTLDGRALDELIKETHIHTRAIEASLSRGKDRLLELNSFRPQPARALIKSIEAQDNDTTLEMFLLSVFDFFNVFHDEVMPRTHTLTFDMAHPGFPVPALKQDGMTVTFDRNIAVTRGEMDFITWDHPLVHGAMELLLGTEKGNCAFVQYRSDGEFSLFLEAIYLLECVVPAHLHMDRFLPVTPIRVVVNHRLEDVTKEYVGQIFSKRLMDGTGAFLREYPEIKEVLLPGMIRACADLAEKQSKQIMATAGEEMGLVLGKEVERLTRLQQKNPAVGGDEVDLARTHLQDLKKGLATARPRLDALRMIYQSV